MSLRYPHTVTVTRTSGATQTATGGWTGGTSTAVYSGRADVQDGEGERVYAEGAWRQRGDAEAYLSVAVGDTGIATGDAVSIAWGDGTTQAARVLDVVRLDDALLLAYEAA